MKKDIDETDARHLKEALDRSFERKTGFDGRSKIFAEDLAIAGVCIPKGTLVWFTKLNSNALDRITATTVRKPDYAVICLNQHRGSTITLEGSFSTINLRNLPVPA